MNLKNKILIILIASIICLLILPSVSAVDYSITNADIDLQVNDDGLINVIELIDFHFDSSANGVYRDIPLKNNQTIENLRIAVDGAYASYQVLNNGNEKRIKIYLYADAAHTKKISSGSDVSVTIKYDISHAIKIYNDVAEIQYKVWGDEWEENLDSLSAVIHFPEDEKLEYWINPYYNNVESYWEDGSLYINSPGVSKGNYIEARAIIPLSEFSSSAPNAQYINQNAADEIRKIQNEDKNSNETLTTIGSIFDIILVLLCSIPLAIYIKFGREPKTNYQAIYEHEPPTNDPPAFVNAMIGGFGKNIGEINQNGFQATIMDLIDKGKLGVDSEKDTEFTKSTFLTVKNTDGLKRYESELISILQTYELNGKISLSYMQDCLKSEYQARDFQRRYNNWCINFKNEYLPDDKLKTFFDNTGYNFMRIFGIIAIILGIIVAAFSLFFSFSGSILTLIIAIVFAVIGIICLILPSGIGGKYTLEGKLYAEKWDKFKKYLNDYSLIKEHPPESIVIWNKYLVYATALGVADNVYKAMKLEVYAGNNNYYDYSDVYMFYYFGGYHYINNSFNTAQSTISAANNDSIGGIGGGSGGGGGGAF